MSTENYSKGLAGITINRYNYFKGIIAGETAICTVGKKGLGLNYRGYDIKDLLANNCTFEDVAYLLIYGKLPTQQEAEEYLKRLHKFRSIPSQLNTGLDR
jgi:2-methylcitrate synthase